MRSSLGLALLVAIAVLLASSAGRASSPTDEARARQELTAGISAAEDGRWSDALGLFRRAYALSPKATTLLNIASAEAQTGQLVRAAESYRLVLRAGDDQVTAEQRAAVKDRLQSLQARIPRLRVIVRGLEREDRVELDGAIVAAPALAGELAVDPGAHTVRLTRGDAAVDEVHPKLGEGELVTVTLGSARASPFTPAPAPARPPEGRSLARNPWLWGGVAVLLVGTGALLCATTLCEGPSPHRGTLGTVGFK